MTSLSIIIPARNAHQFTRNCLVSALQSLAALRLTAQFILIDDASDPAEGILSLFREYRAAAPAHRFVIARSERHQHYTGVFSIGLSLASEERILFLSNDMRITPSFITAVLGVAVLSDSYGIVRGTSNHTDSHPEHAVQIPGLVRSNDDLKNFSRFVFEANGFSHVEDALLSGDAVLLSHKLIDRIGFLDLGFFGYFGDVDYGIRARRAGFKLVCAKGAWLFHEGGGHVKAEVGNSPEKMQAAHAWRMALVQQAYVAFKSKWRLDLPPVYDMNALTNYVAAAEASSAPIELDYRLPADAMSDIRID